MATYNDFGGAAHRGDVTTESTRIDEDPVVVYDIMRESANRLAALYIRQVTVGGTEDPAILEVIAINDKVLAVDVNDLQAQLDLTAEFNRKADRGGRTVIARVGNKALLGGEPPR